MSKSPAKSSFSGSSIKPGAKTIIMSGAAITPMAVMMNKMLAKVPLVAAINDFRSPSPFSRYSASTGIKA